MFDLLIFLFYRVCDIDNDELASAVSRSSDILLTFYEPQHTWMFLEQLTNSRKPSFPKLKIQFVTLLQDPVENRKEAFALSPSVSYKQQYALQMLYSMGYIFQDKYSREIHNRLVQFDEEIFLEICYKLKEKLEENHCYNLKDIFDLFNVDVKEKCEEEKSLGHWIGSISITPLRLLYRKLESSIENRVLRMTEFQNEGMFLLVHIREEDEDELKDFDASIRRQLYRKMFDGIRIMGRTYRLFGASNSQLRKMSFWFFS